MLVTASTTDAVLKAFWTFFEYITGEKLPELRLVYPDAFANAIVLFSYMKWLLSTPLLCPLQEEVARSDKTNSVADYLRVSRNFVVLFDLVYLVIFIWKGQGIPLQSGVLQIILQLHYNTEATIIQ